MFPLMDSPIIIYRSYGRSSVPVYPTRAQSTSNSAPISGTSHGSSKGRPFYTQRLALKLPGSFKREETFTICLYFTPENVEFLLHKSVPARVLLWNPAAVLRYFTRQVKVPGFPNRHSHRWQRIYTHKRGDLLPDSQFFNDFEYCRLGFKKSKTLGFS